MILVDSNVLIDVIRRDPDWHDWSLTALAKALEMDAFINHIIAAELAARMASVEELEETIAGLAIAVRPLGMATAFLAAQAFAAWIDNGGRRGAMLPDLLIGAHAGSLGATILTRDAQRFRTYFPHLTLITPDET